MGASLRRFALAASLLAFGCAEGDGVVQYGGPPVNDLGDAGADGAALEDAAADAKSLPMDGAAPDAPRGCATDDDCASSPDGTVCDALTGRCGGCSPAADRCAPGFVCDGTSLRCERGCSGDGDCTAPTRCDVATRRCTGCESDDQCALGTLCRAGVCVPGCTEARGCGVGFSCCNGACANLQAEQRNCGVCGNDCGATGRCCMGACINVAADTFNCGRCGNLCAAEHGSPVCREGRCAVASCAPGFADCDGNAGNGCESELATSAANCGACANACASSMNATGRCEAGRCGSSCNAGFADCDMDPSNGCEAALAMSPAHCGGCGRACPAGAHATAVCAMGLCGTTCEAGFGDCDGDAGNGCEAELATSAANCGGCGVACAPANAMPQCTAGRCGIGACNAGFADCDGDASNGCEQSIATDSANCGGCGRRCGPGTACQGGVCGSICSGGTTFCTDRCARLDDDPSHCGACGRACAGAANASPECAGGQCGLRCAPGFGNCNGNAADGCETSLRTTTDHCGACGARCVRANASGRCGDGVCRVDACNPGFASCDGADENGCETNTSADVRNCGACGRVCSPPNAGGTCTGGVCALSGCTPGFANCNGVVEDGCEVDTQSSNFNCGACGVSCAPGTACSGGACRSTCAPGTTFCAGVCANLQSDARNCGACDRVCPSGQQCAGGTCAQPAPANDTCGGATVISLGSSEATFSATNVGARGDLSAPCGFGTSADIWYRFTIPGPSRELVYADTFGSSFDTVLFFASGCGSAITGSTTPGDALCNDDAGSVGCAGGLQSQVTALLGPGTYYLVVAGYGGQTGSISLRFQHLPVGNGTVGTVGPGASTLSGSTGGSGQISGCTGSGPEQTWWWRTCPGSGSGNLTATTCSRASWDTVLYLRNGDGGGGACNDDACGLQSSISGTVSAGAGIHALTLDGFGSASGGASIAVTRP